MTKFIENKNYSLKFKTSNEIEIRFRDDDYNQHFTIINEEDAFVINYLNRNVGRLWKILLDQHEQNQLNFEIDEFGKYNIVINEPIFLKYLLKPIEKGKSDVRINQLVKENKDLHKNVENLENKLSYLQKEFDFFKRNQLITHFGRYIKLNTYELNATKLQVTIDENINNINVSNCSLNSLILFSELKDLYLRINYCISQNRECKEKLTQILFEPVGKLNLEILTIELCTFIFNINFVKTITSLEEISIINCTNLESVEELYGLPNLKKVTITNCPKIGSISSADFNSSVDIHQK